MAKQIGISTNRLKRGMNGELYLVVGESLRQGMMRCYVISDDCDPEFEDHIMDIGTPYLSRAKKHDYVTIERGAE